MATRASLPASINAASVPLRALRRLIREPAAQAPTEHCELCGTPLPGEHRHLVDHTSHALLCACGECAVLFERDGAASGRYQAVPRRYLALDGFQLTDEQWDGLLIPVGMAYFFYSTPMRRTVAFYPGPAGAAESLLSLEHWAALVAANPILETLAPDVEALLISRVRGAHAYYIVPIDACYRLVGIIRGAWRGLSGGEEAWQAIGAFFDALRAKSQVVEGAPNV